MEAREIKIGDLVIPRQQQIMNDAPKEKKVIGTVFGYSIATVKKELEPYLNKGYEFYYFSFKINGKNIHTVRILETLENKL